MNKKYFGGFLTILLLVFITPFTISANQPPLPPEIELLVSLPRYTPDTALIIEQLTEDASLCGIKLNVVLMEYIDIVYRIWFNNFEAAMFLTAAWYQPDSFETIIWLLNFYFGSSSYIKYYNPEIKVMIDDLEYFYYNGFIDDAIELFHEIEFLIYEGQFYPTVGYHLDSFLIHTHLIILNNNPFSPLRDTAVRNALSYLINRELYISLMQTVYPYTLYQTSHLFGWSQYHDNTLPDIPYSIGKATSTLAKAGYRPCTVK